VAPKIGLDAVFGTAEFSRGLSEYLSGVGQAEGSTVSAASRISGGLTAIGGTIVLGALAAAAAAIGTVVGAAVAAVPAFTNWAEKLDGIGDVLGTTSEESAALAVAIQKVGGNADDITKQMAFMTKSLVTAKGEVGPAGMMMEELGISFRDANGELLPSIDIIQNVADKVGNMPDGLEKTRIMMGLFGKSGKDMSDALASMAGDGLQAASEAAKEMGLSLSDDATDGAIQLGRQWNMLKMTGQGLMVSFGQELAPALGDLLAKFSELAQDALPKIRAVLPKIASFVSMLAKTIIDNIPVVFGIIQNVFNFLINNKPLVLGVLAAITAAVAFWAFTVISAAVPAIVAFMTAMGPAILVLLAIAAVVTALGYAWENNFMGMRDTLTAFWETTVKPALQQLWNWLSVNIPLALQALSAFWTDVLLPAINAVWAWVQANLIPLLQELWTWLATNVPIALQTLSNFWTTVLLPAITAVWGFITDSLLPLLMALADFISAVLSVAVTALAGFWQNVLQPALKAVWSFIQSNVLPIFKEIADFISSTFGPVVKEIGEWIAGTFVSAWQSLASAIGNVVTWLHDVAAALRGLELPDWLTPGSPTPFELGIRGISDAMSELYSLDLPKLQSGLSLLSPGGSTSASSAAADTSAAPSARGTVQNIFNMGGNTISNGMDLALFEAHVTRVVERSLRGA
jgi:hypothetical protein